MGVHGKVVARAKKILAGLETGTFLGKTVEAQTAPWPEAEEPTLPQLSFFGTGATHPILEELKGLDVDDLTPRDALNLLGEWKKKIKE